MTAENTARHVYVTETFDRAAKRIAKRSPELTEHIHAAVVLLGANMFAASLRTHKLKGELRGCWACSVTYDVRIVFEIGAPQKINGFTAEAIFLLTVGTHDEVY
jgi:mRNA interferase YafQ